MLIRHPLHSTPSLTPLISSPLPEVLSSLLSTLVVVLNLIYCEVLILIYHKADNCFTILLSLHMIYVHPPTPPPRALDKDTHFRPHALTIRLTSKFQQCM